MFLGVSLSEYARGRTQESWCTKGAYDAKKRGTREYLEVVMTCWKFDNLIGAYRSLGEPGGFHNHSYTADARPDLDHPPLARALPFLVGLFH
jgi:hypothetical protein